MLLPIPSYSCHFHLPLSLSLYMSFLSPIQFYFHHCSLSIHKIPWSQPLPVFTSVFHKSLREIKIHTIQPHLREPAACAFGHSLACHATSCQRQRHMTHHLPACQADDVSRDVVMDTFKDTKWWRHYIETLSTVPTVTVLGVIIDTYLSSCQQPISKSGKQLHAFIWISMPLDDKSGIVIYNCCAKSKFVFAKSYRITIWAN